MKRMSSESCKSRVHCTLVAAAIAAGALLQGCSKPPLPPSGSTNAPLPPGVTNISEYRKQQELQRRRGGGGAAPNYRQQYEQKYR